MKWGVARVDQFITAAFLVSGLALVLFVLLGLSLPLTLLAGWSAIAVGIWWFERTAPTDARARFHEVLRVGAIAGAGRHRGLRPQSLRPRPGLRPGHPAVRQAFGAFGDALLPGSGREGWSRVVGVGYHLVNGVSFGIAYTGLFRRRGALTGIAYALGLEAVMLAIYPGWLDIEARREFTQMSLLGHVAYGATLGALARRLLAPEPAPEYDQPAEPAP